MVSAVILPYTMYFAFSGGFIRWKTGFRSSNKTMFLLIKSTGVVQDVRVMSKDFSNNY